MSEYLWLIVVGGIIYFDLLLPCNDTKQFAHLHRVPGPSGIGKQAVMADTMKTVWQNMDEEAADKFTRFQGHGLVSGFPLSPIVLPLEGDAFVIAGDEAAV